MFELTQIASYSPSYWGGSRAVTVTPAGVANQVVTEYDRLGNKIQYNITGLNFNAQYVGITFVDTIKKVIFSQNGTNATQACYYPSNRSVFFFANYNTTLYASGYGSNFVLLNIAYNSATKLVPVSVPALTWNPIALINPPATYSTPYSVSNIVNGRVLLINHTVGQPSAFCTPAFSYGPIFQGPGLPPFRVMIGLNNSVIINNYLVTELWNLTSNKVVSFQLNGLTTTNPPNFVIGPYIIMNFTTYDGVYALYDYTGAQLSTFSMPDSSLIIGVNEYYELITTSGTWKISDIPVIPYYFNLQRHFAHNYSRGVPINQGTQNLILPPNRNIIL